MLVDASRRAGLWCGSHERALILIVNHKAPIAGRLRRMRMTTSTEPDLAARVTRLEDLEAIRALDARYCRHLDDGNWDDRMALFTDDRSEEHTSELQSRT